MVDFANLAAQAKAAHDKKLADDAAAQQEKDNARRKVVDSGIVALQERVLPVLERAAHEIKSQGIQMATDEKFDVYNYHHTVTPRILVHLLGPARRSDGYRFKTISIAFGTFGERLDVFVGTDNYSGSLPDRPSETVDLAQAEGAVGRAVEKLLESYYRTLRDSPAAWQD